MAKILIVLTILALVNLSFSAQCKDNSECPGTTTCCETPKGVGCCPYENAECCIDGQHCCPSSFTCDVKRGRCAKKENRNEFLAFVDTTPLESSMHVVVPKSVLRIAAETSNKSDILKCITDAKPFANDLSQFYNSITSYQEVYEILVKIIKDGFILTQDCLKLIEDLKSYDK